MNREQYEPTQQRRCFSLNRRLCLAIGLVLAVLLIAGIAAAWSFRAPLLELMTLVRDELKPWLSSIGLLWFLIALAVGPLFFLPISAFYLTAGVHGPLIAIPVVWLGLLINISVSYWIAAGVLHPVVSRFVGFLGYRMPRVSSENAMNVVLIVRVAPALPFGIQNYLLGLSRMPFKTYLWVSWTMQALVSIGMILLGDALFHGGAGVAILGISMVVIIGLFVKIARSRYGIETGNDDTSIESATHGLRADAGD